MKRQFSVLNAELVQAWRRLWARPGFSLLAILVLAAGLGSALSIASFMNTLALNPLPFADSESIYRAGLIDNDDSADSERFDAVSGEELRAWSERLDGIATLGAYTTLTVNLSVDQHSERYAGGRFDAGLLQVLGVQPQLGRGFNAEDLQPGAASVVLLSDSLWRQRFQADPAVLGRQIRVNSAPATVIGVMPAQFSFPWREQLWLPLPLPADRDECCFDLLLRPLPGHSPSAIRTVLEHWFADASARNPEAMRSRARAVGFDQMKYQFVDRATLRLFNVMALAVGLVLLIACANVANLLLGAQLARDRELALRSALGASRGRLLLAALLHAGMLSLAALLLALPLAQLGVEATVATLRASVDNGPPHWMQFSINARMIAIAVLIAILTALFSGLLPALQAGARRDLDLRGSNQGAARFARASQWLMVGQVALSLAVLIATALLLQTVRKLNQFDLGLNTQNVLTARLGLTPERYADPAQVQQQVDRLLQAIRAEPGVAAASLSSSLPGLMGDNREVVALGAALPAAGYANPGYSAVDSEFFTAMGASLVAGRLFNNADDASSEPVMIVDQTFVEQFLPGQQAVGRQFVLDPSEQPQRVVTIVGVVRPIQMDDIDDAREAAMFVPFAQAPQRYLSVLVRTRGAPQAFAERLAALGRAQDADSPLYWVRDYADVLFEASIGQHMLAQMFGAFGLVALLLAATGLYGVVAFNVGRRTREIGIRRALGAANGRLLRALLLRTLSQVGLGLVLGLGLGLALASVLGAQLGSVGMQASDFIGVGIWLPALALLSAAAALASWLPARRALAIEPTVALRYE